jgi:hypothetical protein
MAKMPKSLISWIMPKLRRASMYWPGKSIARDQAKIQIQEGTFQNGKPKFKTYYICAECERQGVEKPYHERDFTAMDHVIPVIDVKGFDGDWTKLMETLFCSPDNYQCLCFPHHEQKTIEENKQRVTIKKMKRFSSNKSKIQAKKRVNTKKKKLTTRKK